MSILIKMSVSSIVLYHLQSVKKAYRIVFVSLSAITQYIVHEMGSQNWAFKKVNWQVDLDRQKIYQKSWEGIFV